MRQVAEWLEKLGMSEYAQRFAENGISNEALRHLTDQDLKEVGVLLGHRRIMLAAIAKLTEATEAISQPIVGSEAWSRDAAERRQVTVMFSDLVGSTALSASMDPEDMREVISAYQKCVAATVQPFGGFVAKYMGDGVLVYFGYPEAHEDDAERAVRAGLQLIDTISGVDPRSGSQLQVRIGVATGLVVVGELIGEGTAEERVAVGETLNLAARIQAAAPPNALVVSEATHRLSGPAFTYEDRGRHKLKGVPGRATLWRVVGESGAHGRFDARVGQGLTPLVGRGEEIGLLRSRWNCAKEGEGQIALLSAPAGFGKSRITAAFRERLRDSSITCLQFFGSPFHTSSPFYPFIVQLEWAAGIARTDSEAQKLDKLEAVLVGSSEAKSDFAPLLAALLSIPSAERYPPLQINEQIQKQRTMDALLEQLLARHPAVRYWRCLKTRIGSIRRRSN
ncbi:MAG: adenylate/guanylate cyclase domain-containing protein [Bradyrhizobium sp.]